jgi:DNA cross-link repair 1A protein
LIVFFKKIGSYTIGKEKIFVEIAKKFDTKIFVNDKKYELLEKMEIFDLSLFTKDAAISDFHVVDMRSLSYKNITSLYSSFKNKYTKIIGFPFLFFLCFLFFLF